ncbi:MAG TPA: GumC family protein, partial [Oligoflexia bacterium]|nr:GumC family protein [Oligoflexia bacterium]
MAEKNNEFPARIITLPVYARDPYAAQEGYDLAPPEESDGTQRTLHDYIELLITYRWPVASVILTVLFGTLLYNLLATPLYTSEAKLKISLYSPVLPGARLEDALRQQTRENEYFQTETELASSLTLAERVLSSPEIEADVRAYLRRRTGLFSVFAPFLRLLRKDKGQETAPASPGGYSFPVNLLQAYLGLVQVQPVRKTSLVTISVTTADPVLSAKIANRHSESFIELSREERQRAVLENLLFLKNQADELGDKVSQAERNLAAYAEENALVTDPKGESITLKRTAELSQLLTQATARRIQSESIFNGAKSGAGADSTSLDDSSLQNLRLRLKEVEAEYAMLSEKFAPGYPKMVQLQSRIAELRENIREQRAQALNALEGRYRADLEAEAELKRQLEIQKSSGFDQARREVQYNSMKREYESLKELYQSVLRQVKETQVSAAGQGTNISLADRAAVPMGHSSPRRMMNIIFAMLCGPLMGISLALLLDALDNTFKSPEQLQAVLNLPVLGVVPSFLAEVGLEKDFAAKTASF